MSPTLTVLLAATVGWTAPDDRFLAVMTAHVMEVSNGVVSEVKESPPTITNIPYYFERISAVSIPETPIRITYDRHLPIFRTKP